MKAWRIYGIGDMRLDDAMMPEENIIPGLYAASVLADGWAGQTYPADEMGGSAFGFAINSGYIAGESAAKYVLKNKGKR